MKGKTSLLCENMLPKQFRLARLRCPKDVCRELYPTFLAGDSNTYHKVCDSVSSSKLYICVYTAKCLKFALTNRQLVFLYPDAKISFKGENSIKFKLGIRMRFNLRSPRGDKLWVLLKKIHLNFRVAIEQHQSKLIKNPTKTADNQCS